MKNQRIDTETEVQNKSALIDRIRARYVLLVGKAIPVELFAQVKSISFSDMLELIIEIESLDRRKLPIGGVDGLIESWIVKTVPKKN